MGSRRVVPACLVALLLAPGVPTHAGAPPTRAEVLQGLRRAAGFYREQAARHGGYVWTSSADLSFRKGEAVVDDQTIWVQPPGTPTVGGAFLDAFEATGDRYYLDAAREAAGALVKGQLQSGGWAYSITFDPEKRQEFAYRVPPGQGPPTVRDDPKSPGGWDVWRQRKYPGNRTMLDDETTQSALRFLMRVDRALDFNDDAIHEAVGYGLRALMGVQYPNGAFSHNYDRYPTRRPDPAHYPVLQASYPASWSRTWTKDFTGCYVLNDEITPDTIAVFLDAYKIYGEQAHLDAALRGGDFLIRAQMPEPQPAWAQQYDRAMHPVWDRKFEPPAITGHESQAVLETLLRLYRETGEARFLEPIPKALGYLQKSRLPDGRLARFYELKTNRPLYFTRDYQLTYDPRNSPTHYGFAFESRLDAIAAEYERLRQAPPAERGEKPEAVENSEELSDRVAAILAALDDRGAWVEGPKRLIESRTFTDNVSALCRYLRGSK